MVGPGHKNISAQKSLHENFPNYGNRFPGIQSFSPFTLRGLWSWPSWVQGIMTCDYAGKDHAYQQLGKQGTYVVRDFFKVRYLKGAHQIVRGTLLPPEAPGALAAAARGRTSSKRGCGEAS